MKSKKMRGMIALAISFLLLAGCASKPADEADDTPLPEASAQTTRTEEASVSDLLIGFVIPDSEDISLRTSLHGFLRTAENLGYPSKVYDAEEGAPSVAAVELAAQEGCAGLLVWNKNNTNTAAVARARELGLPVVIPYYSAEGTEANANVLADVNGYGEEAALGVAERMVERNLKSGKILVYGTSPAHLYDVFTEAIAAYYPQYNVGYFTRTAALEQPAIDELANYILENRDIKGMYCMDAGGAAIGVKAREKAISDFKAKGGEQGASPSPTAAPLENTPTPTISSVAPSATPIPEGLLKSIVISVFGYGLDDGTVALLQENDIQAFVLEPYYEASAQSVMLLDRILKGESVPRVTRLNMPIVRLATLDKYLITHKQVLEWFSLSQENTLGIG